MRSAFLWVSAQCVPAMIKFSGTIAGAPGHFVGLTFALYKFQQGGAPFWLETQSLSVDAAGRYSCNWAPGCPTGCPGNYSLPGKRAGSACSVKGKRNVRASCC